MLYQLSYTRPVRRLNAPCGSEMQWLSTGKSMKRAISLEVYTIRGVKTSISALFCLAGSLGQCVCGLRTTPRSIRFRKSQGLA